MRGRDYFRCKKNLENSRGFSHRTIYGFYILVSTFYIALKDSGEGGGGGRGGLKYEKTGHTKYLKDLRTKGNISSS